VRAFTERTRFVKLPVNVSAEFPRPVTFYAEALSDDDTPVTYTWYHNGHPLVSDDIRCVSLTALGLSLLLFN